MKHRRREIVRILGWINHERFTVLLDVTHLLQSHERDMARKRQLPPNKFGQTLKSQDALSMQDNPDFCLDAASRKIATASAAGSWLRNGSLEPVTSLLHREIDPHASGQ